MTEVLRRADCSSQVNFEGGSALTIHIVVLVTPIKDVDCPTVDVDEVRSELRHDIGNDFMYS